MAKFWIWNNGRLIINIDHISKLEVNNFGSRTNYLLHTILGTINLSEEEYQKLVEFIVARDK